jgi:gliding motility-associated-like protein
MKIFIKFSILLIVGCFNFVYAQGNENPPIQYRVVAYSESDISIQSASNELSLYQPLKLYVPTAFSPNGDGLNDTFGAVGEGIEDYKLIVYNRWGEVVFASNNINQKWDGDYQGSPVSFGAYSYQLFAYGKEFGEVNKSGAVIVIN